jgi:hypothetical protein
MPARLTRKSLQDDLAFVERQLALQTDPFDTVRLMWEKRREALLEEIASAVESKRANIALIFEGSPVVGSEEIRLDFATKALDNYQAVVSSLVAERAGAELGKRGRLPQSFSSKLFIRDMVRGSVGFVLEEPRGGQYPLLETALQEAVEEATRILRDMSRAEEQSFETRVAQLSPRTLQAIKRLAKVLHDAGAATQLIGNVEEFTLDHIGTASLYSRLENLEVVERQERKEGVLLGLFPERQQYEFRPADGSPVFYGPVSETLDARYLTNSEYARSIILKPATATFNVVSTLRSGVRQSEVWVLEDIQVFTE